MRVHVALWIGVAACGSAGSPDTCVPWECFPEVACQQGEADRGGQGYLPCGLDWHACYLDRATCNAGCTLEVNVPGGFDFDGDVSLLCAETPSAAIGDPCDRRCLPTRAAIATDGTVTQQYLACATDPSTNVSACAAAPAPIVDGYLQPCGAYELADAKAHPGVDGVGVQNCLFAWDGATLHAGRTFRCLGDWECPDGSLCDDQLFYLDGTDRSPGVCKPGGPRGVIDPARLPTG